MKKTIKAEIKTTVGTALDDVVQQLKISKPSRKTKKAISRVAKALRSDLKIEMKKQIKKATAPSKTRGLKAIKAEA
ncbi:MAG: hypothetical protein WKF87_08100 [Chryseolinea sp.]